MARKRYISTNISTDEKILDLEDRSGPYGVILYTMMIPHAADDGTLTGRPRELKMLCVPGFAMSAAEVEQALTAMVEIGLIERVDDGRVRFPSRTFYAYQAYVKPDRRHVETVAREQETQEPVEPVPTPSGDPGKIHEFPGTSEKTLASSSLSSSSSGSEEPDGSSARPPQRAAPEERTKRSVEQVRKTADPSAGLAPLFEAFSAIGLPRPMMSRSEPIAAAALLKLYVADDLAACWRDHASGAYGDAFSQRDLSFDYLANRNRVGNWLEWRKAGCKSPATVPRQRSTPPVEVDPELDAFRAFMDAG